MRAAILLLALAGLLIGTSWNTAWLFQTAAALYENEAARKFYAIGLCLTGAALGLLAIVLLARRAARTIDDDSDVWSQIDSQK